MISQLLQRIFKIVEHIEDKADLDHIHSNFYNLIILVVTHHSSDKRHITTRDMQCSFNIL